MGGRKKCRSCSSRCPHRQKKEKKDAADDSGIYTPSPVPSGPIKEFMVGIAEGERLLAVSDLTVGGGAIACRRLCRALRKEGHPIRWLAMKGSSDEDVTSVQDWPDLKTFLFKRMVNWSNPSPTMVASLDRRHNAASLLGFVKRVKPTLINLHNIHDAADFGVVEELVRCAPVVWTLHDLWAVTGGCYYPYACGVFDDACKGPCEHPTDYADGTAAHERERRLSFLKRHADRMVLVSPSAWLAGVVSKVVGSNVRVKHVPNSLDRDVFVPLNRKAVRESLGLPVDAQIIATGATWFSEERKGGLLLRDAVTRLPPPPGNRERIVLGIGDTPHGQQNPPGWRFLGRIRDEQLLNLYYNAADVYVLATLADNLPNTLLESHAAGTPCVAFDTGGCREIVRDGETGFLAKHGDVGDLAATIERTLALPEVEQVCFRQACHTWATSQYSPERQARSYRQVFNELISR
jgi:glycosyltransferase involved in cell wall biosynthesis